MVADSDRFGELATERVGAEVKGVDLDLFRLSFALSRTATRFVRRVESTVHRPAGLTWAGFRVLFTVWACGSMESHQIAHLSGLSRASVSSAVNTLERDGMVARSRESTDRRLVTVSLTGRGSDLVSDAYAAQHRQEEALFAGLEVEEVVALTRMLERVLATPWPAEEV
jgi:DNA-binding MarR family transcriptional regulator